MKKIIYIAIFILLFSSLVQAEDTKKCEDCTYDKPCGYTEPAGDGCNTCSGSTWCVDGKWYTNGTYMCTLLACIKTYEIPNPFKEVK